MNLPVYSLDTSGLLDGLERYYPPETFPALWERMDGLIGDGRLIASEEVWEELQKRDEIGARWMQARKDEMLVPTDANVVAVVRDILQHPDHRRLVMNGKGRNNADPFVIAVAELHGAVVVTGEDGGSRQRPRIPSVCNDRAVDCIPFLGIVQREGWTFR